ncbi:class I SAM-dependent methyltransferase [Myxococcota bacterium]|nr:class I SAM-dependent methyltransferase [Myxococcota bacterium]MBU1381127.1 class I SAM-dependent methyltransferase [Myxococcota bacterium]MBU1496038.1 class I SAM-dependent methyltransferase [Myxococcota bacterium]
MATVREHYENVLSSVYIWMNGGFESAIEKNIEFFNSNKILPVRSGRAVDLGAGCGFQSIPLAMSGFSVTAIDIDARLLNELESHSENLPVKTVQCDLMDFEKHIDGKLELAVCMTDTICHLESINDVITLMTRVSASLEDNGLLILTFRDYSSELSELDRFIPVKSDDSTIFTCFLEYESETVKVHDIVYRKINDNWQIFKSYYRKLRLSKEWICAQLSKAGFRQINSTIDKGMITIIAEKGSGSEA